METEKETARSFPLGKVVTTLKVAAAINEKRGFDLFILSCISKFQDGDWGCLNDEDKKASDEAVKNGGRIKGSYLFPVDDTEVWIITEADRRYTTILFPDEY